MRLIDADALIVDVAHRNALDVIPGADFENIWLYATVQRDMFELVKAAPTIDAVPVVRCKDCIYRGAHDLCPMCARVHMLDESIYIDCTVDDGFCNRGEKVDGGADRGV